MNNYKIRVNNEAESREAQELFSQLGFERAWDKEKLGFEPNHIFSKDGVLTWLHHDRILFEEHENEELTLPQLRDLAVLHRNDVSDRTHLYTTSSGEEISSILVGDWWHIFTGGIWQKFMHKDSEKTLLMDLIEKPHEQCLISGADAKIAWAKGQDLQIDTGSGFEDLTDNYYLAVFDRESNKFRLKPRTIKLEIEVPAPFEPKDGELFWHISPEYEKGFAKSMYDDRNVNTWQQFGAWRTEAEIKIVVEQIRKLKEHSK